MEETKRHHEILDKIPQGAAIIRRGIVKQINQSFAQLLGYRIEEITDKSLFDFVAPEGFAEIEKYYLNRLRGSNASTYETVFSTKGNNIVVVEVSIKPTTYDGEKAEIVVFKPLEH